MTLSRGRIHRPTTATPRSGSAGSRKCPQCGALPTWRCYRITSSGAQVPLKTFHAERVNPPTKETQ